MENKEKKLYEYPMALTQQFRFCGNPFRIDTYKGCNFGCVYCFATSRNGNFDKKSNVANLDALEKTFFNAFENPNAKETLNIELLRHRVPLHLGGLSDPFQSKEFHYKVTLRLLGILKKYNYPTMVSTKQWDFPEEYWEAFDPGFLAFQVSMIGVSNDFIRKYETRTATFEQRLDFIKKLKSKGYWVAVRLQPLIDIEEAEKLVDATADIVDYITVEHLKIPNDDKEIRAFFEPIDKEIWKKPNTSIRNIELDTEIKEQNIARLKKIANGRVKLGIGDNDLHNLSESRNCCGMDLIGEHFNNYLKYNWTYFQTGEVENKDELWVPKANVHNVFNSHTRNRNYDFKEYTEDYIKKFEKGREDAKKRKLKKQQENT